MSPLRGSSQYPFRKPGATDMRSLRPGASTMTKPEKAKTGAPLVGRASGYAVKGRFTVRQVWPNGVARSAVQPGSLLWCGHLARTLTRRGANTCHKHRQQDTHSSQKPWASSAVRLKPGFPRDGGLDSGAGHHATDGAVGVKAPASAQRRSRKWIEFPSGPSLSPEGTPFSPGLCHGQSPWWRARLGDEQRLTQAAGEALGWVVVLNTALALDDIAHGKARASRITEACEHFLE